MSCSETSTDTDEEVVVSATDYFKSAKRIFGHKLYVAAVEARGFFQADGTGFEADLLRELVSWIPGIDEVVVDLYDNSQYDHIVTLIRAGHVDFLVQQVLLTVSDQANFQLATLVLDLELATPESAGSSWLFSNNSCHLLLWMQFSFDRFVATGRYRTLLDRYGFTPSIIPPPMFSIQKFQIPRFCITEQFLAPLGGCPQPHPVVLTIKHLN